MNDGIMNNGMTYDVYMGWRVWYDEDSGDRDKIYYLTLFDCMYEWTT